MIGVIASEWLKLRSMRSSAHALLAMALAVLLSAYLTWHAVAAWDELPPPARAAFRLPEVERIVLLALQLCAAVVGALAITAEHATGAIRTTLLAVPRRLTLLAAKMTVVAAVAFAGSLATALVFYFVTGAVIAERAIASEVLRSIEDAALLFTSCLACVIVSLTSFGLGAWLRSSAATLACIVAALFLPPMVAGYLPAPWDVRVASIALTGLPHVLSGHARCAATPQMFVAAVYVVAALGIGAVMTLRRDS